MPDIDWEDEEVQAMLQAKIDEAVSGLKEKNGELLGKLTKFKDVDPEEYQKLKDQAEELEKAKKDKDRKEAESKGEWERIIAENKTEFERQLEAKTKSINKREEQIRRLVVSDKVTKAIAAENGNPLFLEHHVTQHVKVVENDEGEFEVQVLNKDGTRKLMDSGSYATVQDFVKELKNDERFAAAFAGTMATGSGGSGTTETANNDPNPWAEGSINLTQQSLITRNDPEKAKRLKAAAGL